LSVYARYDEQIRDAKDRHGDHAAAASARTSAQSGGLVPAQPGHYFFARDWTAGTRYDITDNVSAWGEFHYVDGVAWVNPLDNPGFNHGTADRYWNFLAVMLAYRF
jgi:hypothetical protein